MKITLYGASGMIGSRILDELMSRGHDVLAVVRNPSRVTRTDVEVRAGPQKRACQVGTAVHQMLAVVQQQ